MGVPIPASIPHMRLDNLSQQEADIGETCEFEAGEPLRAPIYRSVPNTFEARWVLTQAEFDTFVDWFEDDLLAGNLPADLVKSEQGTTGSHTVEAMFLTPPVERLIQGGALWEVSAPCVSGVSFST